MVTLLDPPKGTWSDTTTHRRAITDLVSIISPRDHPILSYFGFSKAAKTGWGIVNWPSYQVEWLEDELHSRADSLDGSITSTATTITLHDQSVTHEGDLLLVDSEYLWVSARSASGQVVTVVRSVGSTNASHADDAAVYVVGNGRLEGADADISSFTDVSSGTNYTQILEEAIKVTRTMEKLSQYGIEGEYERQKMKKTAEAMIKLELSLVHGRRQGPGTASVPRLLGGLDYFLNSSGGNTVDASTSVTQANFEDALEMAYMDGGKPSVAFVSPANMQVIKNFYDSSLYLRVERGENTVGMNINKIITSFGDIDLVMDRYMPNSIIPIIDPEHFMILAYDEFQEQKLGIKGDYVEGEIIGEFTCCIRHPLTAHAMVMGIGA